jgi:homospermidine synthase
VADLAGGVKEFPGNIVVLGFGSIGSGLMPLLFDRFVEPRVRVVTSDDRNLGIAQEYEVEHHVEAITESNYAGILERHVSPGDFLVNLTVDVDSLDVMKWCAAAGVLYIDTVIEPWAGYYTDERLPAYERSNSFLRQRVLDHRAAAGTGPTAIIAHGANPGLVNHFVKDALLQIAAENGIDANPRRRADWIALAGTLGIKVVHVAERDTQRSAAPKDRGEFVNTWSVDGFISEGCQPSELGWGTHEKTMPADGNRNPGGSDAAIYLDQPGVMTRVRSWTPDEGPMHGWIITHNESISIADYFSGPVEGELYRPTVHYAYHPCDAAVNSIHELAGRNYVPQERQRIIVDEVIDGVDELGVLLMGNDRGSLWYGSNLSIEEAREAAPHNNATSLQVVAPVLAGMFWAIDNPEAGIVEADELPHDAIIDVCRPYLGRMVSAWTDWTPLEGRGVLFAEDVDSSDPWQFGNFRVS